MRGRPGEELLHLPVRLHGIQLGRPVDLIVDLDAERVLGLDVLCGDEAHRFLPLAAARVGDEEITVTSALMLLEEAELAFYRSRASALSSLRGAPLELGGRAIGRLRDLVLGEAGTLAGVLVEEDGEVTTVDLAEGLSLKPVTAV